MQRYKDGANRAAADPDSGITVNNLTVMPLSGIKAGRERPAQSDKADRSLRRDRHDGNRPERRKVQKNAPEFIEHTIKRLERADGAGAGRTGKARK